MRDIKLDPGVAASPHEQGQVCVGLWDLKLWIWIANPGKMLPYLGQPCVNHKHRFKKVKKIAVIMETEIGKCC